MYLKLKRYLQSPGCCAYGAAASVGHYFDKRITYDFVCKLDKPTGDGLYTPQITCLLNQLGFTSVTVVTTDINVFDFNWKSLNNDKLYEQLRQAGRKNPSLEYREIARYYAKWLADKNNDNNIVIDYHFGDYIRKHLLSGNPVMASFVWNMFFKWPKRKDNGEIDPIKGDVEHHEVVLYGFDEKKVRVLDSHQEMYKGKLKKYASGRYQMTWETLMTVMGYGDLILPGNFDKERLDALVSKIDKSSK